LFKRRGGDYDHMTLVQLPPSSANYVLDNGALRGLSMLS